MKSELGEKYKNLPVAGLYFLNLKNMYILYLNGVWELYMSERSHWEESIWT